MSSSETEPEKPLTYGEVYFNRTASRLPSRYSLLKGGDDDEEEEIQIYKNKNSLRKFYVLVGSMVFLAMTFTVVFAWCTMVAARRSNFGTRIVDEYAVKRKLMRPGGGRENAVVIILCRNREIIPMLQTMHQFEEKFNSQFNYPYVFLNNEPFTEEFKATMSTATKARVSFGLVEPEHWGVPARYNSSRIQESLRELKSVVHGSSLSYRQMCRWYSGFFQEHQLLSGFDFYWRLEPGVSFSCKVPYDPFEYMRRNRKMYGFSMAINEIKETIPSLWKTTSDFLEIHKKTLPRDQRMMDYFRTVALDYNGCHFWSNFEIAAFSLFRSPQYKAFFEHLDEAGGFFYERWGDAPVHSLAVGMLLTPEQVHWFSDIGYKHHPHAHCPADFNLRLERQCECDPDALDGVSQGHCMQSFLRLTASEPELDAAI